jgi:3-oxoacyl-ACP reductase-like protein
MNRKIILGLSALALLCGATPALAQESGLSTWSSSVTWQSANDRIVDLQIAEAIRRNQEDGYGPGSTNVTYNGDVTTNNTYNGPVSNVSSTNAVNLTTNSSSVDLNGSGSVDITYENSATSYSATQNAAAQNAQSENGSSSNAASGSANGNP